jgi:hypothetical protein
MGTVQGGIEMGGGGGGTVWQEKFTALLAQFVVHKTLDSELDPDPQP